MKKKKEEGQKKKGKDSKENNPTKKSDQMSKNDFLICPETGLVKDSISPEFEFSNGDDESDVSDDTFEDPKEEIADNDETSTANVGEEFLTPVNLKSTFARTLAKSTTRSTSMSTSNTAKRPSGSPADIKDPKKSKATQSQSLLPKKK